MTSPSAEFAEYDSFEDFSNGHQPYRDINSPTDSVIGRDFQELSAEEQERQREEWKAELKKTEEEILTLKQVLTAKERHAAGLKRRLGITAWREFSEDMTSGMVANITSSGYFQSVSSAFGAAKTKISSSMSQQSFNDVLNEQNGGQPATTPTAEQKQ